MLWEFIDYVCSVKLKRDCHFRLPTFGYVPCRSLQRRAHLARHRRSFAVASFYWSSNVCLRVSRQRIRCWIMRVDMKKPIIAITMGDAAGVGPEVIMKSLSHPEVHELCCPLVIGDATRLREAGRIVGSTLAVRSLAPT